MEQRIKVINPNKGWLRTEYYIDGHEISDVKKIDFHVAVDETPVFTFETFGLPDIDMSGDIFFKFTPDTVQQAILILQNEFKNNEESQNALILAIKRYWVFMVVQSVHKRFLMIFIMHMHQFTAYRTI